MPIATLNPIPLAGRPLLAVGPASAACSTPTAIVGGPLQPPRPPSPAMVAALSAYSPDPAADVADAAAREAEIAGQPDDVLALAHLSDASPRVLDALAAHSASGRVAVLAVRERALRETR